MIIFLNKKELDKVNLKDLLNQVGKNHSLLTDNAEKTFGGIECAIIEEKDSAEDIF